MPDNDTLLLAKSIVNHALEKKAQDVQILDLKNVTSMTDYFIICHGESEPHVKAIAKSIMDGCAKSKIKPWHKEGMQNLRWVLLDYIDVIVHVFQEEERKFYGLERLWGDAPKESFR